MGSCYVSVEYFDPLSKFRRKLTGTTQNQLWPVLCQATTSIAVPESMFQYVTKPKKVATYGADDFLDTTRQRSHRDHVSQSWVRGAGETMRAHDLAFGVRSRAGREGRGLDHWQ